MILPFFRPRGALIAFGILLLAAFRSGAASGWQPPVRLDSGGGAHPTVCWSPDGGLRVFYSLEGTPGRLVLRQWPAGEAGFSPEIAVRDDGRTVAAHNGADGTITVALATRGDVIVLQSADDGATWEHRHTYPARAGGDLTSYLPSAFTEDGADLRLVYGFQNRSLFGPLPEVRHAVRTAGTWPASGALVNAGEVRGAVEQGDTVCVVTSQGVLRSTDNGATFEVLGRQGPLPEQLAASDMALASDNRIYLLHSYSYGRAGKSEQLAFTYSDDLGATWLSPQRPVVADAGHYLFAPRFAVDGKRMAVVWQQAAEPNQHRYIRGVTSSDAGRTWEPVETIVTLTGTQTLDPSGALDIASRGGRTILVYAVRDGLAPAGVFLQEWIPDSSREDFDEDGLPDRWEEAHFGGTASQDGDGDPDGDGLDNAGELAAMTDPKAADSDGDGLGDAAERLAGTDPANPREVLRLTVFRRGADRIDLEWTAVRGKTYSVQHSPDLTSWTEIDRVRSRGAQAGSADRHAARIAAAGGFYRVRVLP